MKNKNYFNYAFLLLSFIWTWGCKIPVNIIKNESKTLPASYNSSSDTTKRRKLSWKQYFADSNLASIIETALKNNQELNIILQEIEISKNEIRARKGEYLPFVGLRGESGAEKLSRYTWNGAVEQNLELKNGPKIFESKTDHIYGAIATWEVDIWKKLRNAKQSAIEKYLASIEGKNFMLTNLISEIANSYYELIALDNLSEIVQKNIEIQKDALFVVKLQKESAKLTQLAVNRFEAQLLNTQNLLFDIKQKITETENHINFLAGRYPQPIYRNYKEFNNLNIDSLQKGIPSQLLENRFDIKRAEYELASTKLDVKVARANFYPSISISAGLGFRAFNPSYIVSPESFIYNLAGEIVSPLINRNALIATYNNASAKQIQAVYNYEQCILNAYTDVLNQLAKIDNYTKSYNIKFQEVEILVNSINIAKNLFNYARADYAEVLLTQREALESKMELIEIKLKLMNGKVNIFRALGGF